MSFIGGLDFVLDIVILFILIAIVLLLWGNRKRLKRIDKLFGRLEKIRTN